MRSKIFVSYRRNDSPSATGRLQDALVQHFGNESVFVDVKDLVDGTKYRDAIEAALGSCSVMLVVIGPRWVDARDAEGRRKLDLEGDIVRHEIRSAFARGIPVIPLLVEGASLPREQDLPEDLRALRDHQARELEYERWAADSRELLRVLETRHGIAVRPRDAEAPIAAPEPARAREATPAHPPSPDGARPTASTAPRKSGSAAPWVIGTAIGCAGLASIAVAGLAIYGASLDGDEDEDGMAVMPTPYPVVTPSPSPSSASAEIGALALRFDPTHLADGWTISPYAAVHLALEGELHDAVGRTAQVVVRFKMQNGTPLFAAPGDLLHSDPSGGLAVASLPVVVSETPFDVSDLVMSMPYASFFLNPTGYATRYPLTAQATLLLDGVEIRRGAPTPFDVVW